MRPRIPRLWRPVLYDRLTATKRLELRSGEQHLLSFQRPRQKTVVALRDSQGSARSVIP